MKKLISTLAVFVIISCSKNIESPKAVEEIATAKATSKICNPVCDITKSPDLQLVINAEQDTLYPDGHIDSSAYFWTRYHVRAEPIRLIQNYLVSGIYAIRYGWDSAVRVNMVRLQCLVENVAPFDSTCGNDWVYNESQGKYNPTTFTYFFDGLLSFDTYEQGNGNNWRLLYTDFKKEFFPDAIPSVPYIYNTDVCYYYGIGQRAVQAQHGDFYYNYFRFPNHDGVWKLVLKFNPVSKNGCRVVKETNYANNEKTVYIRISNGVVTHSLTPNI